MAELLPILAKEGILGILLAASFAALVALYKKLNAVHKEKSTVEEKRTQDAQKVVEVLLTQSEKVNATLQSISSAVENQGMAIRAIESEVKLVAALSRKRD